MKKVINSPKAPKAIGPYSQAIEANGFLYISGQLPVDVNTGKIVEGGIDFVKIRYRFGLVPVCVANPLKPSKLAICLALRCKTGSHVLRNGLPANAERPPLLRKTACRAMQHVPL